MTQFSLFHSPITRPTDPLTSLRAAVETVPKLAGRRAEFVRCLTLLGKPSTAQEIAMQADCTIRESVRKRAAECVRLGFVRIVDCRVCSVTGKEASVYLLNE